MGIEDGLVKGVRHMVEFFEDGPKVMRATRGPARDAAVHDMVAVMDVYARELAQVAEQPASLLFDPFKGSRQALFAFQRKYGTRPEPRPEKRP